MVGVQFWSTAGQATAETVVPMVIWKPRWHLQVGSFARWTAHGSSPFVWTHYAVAPAFAEATSIMATRVTGRSSFSQFLGRRFLCEAFIELKCKSSSPINCEGHRRVKGFACPPLFNYPALWWLHSSPLRRWFAFATSRGGHLPIYLPRKVNGLVGRPVSQIGVELSTSWSFAIHHHHHHHHHHHRLSSVFHATHRLDVFPQSSSSNSFSPVLTLSLVQETSSLYSF